MIVITSNADQKMRAFDPNLLPMPAWPESVFPHEPVYSWLHRAAETNGAYSVKGFYEGFGINGKNPSYDEMIEVVQQLPINGIDQLRSNTPLAHENGFVLGEQVLPARCIIKGKRRVCPICLEESRHARFWFDLLPMVSCPLHKVALIDGLPGDPLNWRFPEIGWTKSGIKIGSQHASSPVHSELDQWIARSIGLLPKAAPEPLDVEPLATVINASYCIGLTYTGPVAKAASSSAYQHSAQIGFPPLRGGLESLIDFWMAASWLKPEMDLHAYNANCAGALHRFTTISSPVLHSLAKESFARARIRIGVAAPIGTFAKLDGEDGAITRKAAAASLNMRAEDLQKVMDKVGLSPRKCRRTGVLRVTPSDLKAVKKHIEQCFSEEQAASILRCEVEDLNQKVQAKRLRVSFRACGKRYYDPSAIIEMIDDADIIDEVDFRDEAATELGETLSGVIGTKKPHHHREELGITPQ